MRALKWFMGLLCVASVSAHAASFDCSKATTAVEKMICANPEISALDDQLGSTYKSAMEKTADRQSLEAGQLKWLKQTRNVCTDENCLSLAYKSRLKWLGSVLEEAAMIPPLDGVTHGATKEAFDKVIEHFRTHHYKVATMPDGKPIDYTGGHCGEILEALSKGEVTYVEPKISTDDYNDPRLDPYKKKLHEHYAKTKWADVPWVDWLGGGVAEYAKGGIMYVEHPTRNLSVYELSLDGGKSTQVIFYGEIYITAYPAPEGLTDFKIDYKSKYDFFEFSPWVEWELSGGSQDSKQSKGWYSTVFSFSGKYYETKGDDKVITGLEKYKLDSGRYAFDRTVCAMSE